MFSWQYSMWKEYLIGFNLGYSLKYRNRNSDIAFGIHKSMRNALLEYPDSGRAYKSYRRKNVAGNVLTYGGLSLMLGGFFPIAMGTSNSNDYAIAAGSCMLLGGLISYIIGRPIYLSGKESLFRSANMFNRNKMAELNTGPTTRLDSFQLSGPQSSARNSTNRSNAARQSREPASAPVLGEPNVLQTALNMLPAVPIAGNNLKFQFGGDRWIATLNGENFSAGTIGLEDTDDGSILTLKQTHIWPGAVGRTAGRIANRIPGGATVAGALNTAGRIAGALGAIEASGPEIVLEYRKGPPASLRLYRN